MARGLRWFQDAYASLVVAVYEPVILRWTSVLTLKKVADHFTGRPAKLGRSAPSTALEAEMIRLAKKHGRVESDAVLVPTTLVPGYRVGSGPTSGEFPTPVPGTAEGSPPPTSDEARFVLVDPRLRTPPRPAPEGEWMSRLVAAARAAAHGNVPLGPEIGKVLSDAKALDFFPQTRLEEALSPIGVAHYSRQLYFNLEEGVGPLEQAFTIAPLETLEVVHETVVRRSHEEEVERGEETTTEQASEEKQSDEVSDKVAQMVERQSSVAISASAGGSIGVWSGSASVSLTSSTSGQRASEETSKRLKELTKRASERITKSFKIRTRETNEITTSQLTRRTIRNESPDPVSYGLRRVMRRVQVKVQDLGPRLVWQVYVKEPGIGLARSRFVQFAEAADVAVPELPPGVRPRPKGGTDRGEQVAKIEGGAGTANASGLISFQITPGLDRRILGVSIDDIVDLESGGSDDQVAVTEGAVTISQPDATTGTCTVSFPVRQGDTRSVRVQYSFAWEPSDKAMQEWNAEREAARTQLHQQDLTEQFERQRALITQLRSVKPRPAADLRQEERHEVYARLVDLLFAGGELDVTPVEIESFHRYFEVDAMFVYTHPAWWRPRAPADLRRSSYPITAESNPAPLGASLGWEIQLDGDARRNEFLNSPWARSCIPIRPGREREAIEWLARHMEGQIGYDPQAGELAQLLTAFEARRAQESSLGRSGPEWITISSTASDSPEPASPEGVFPIVDQFEVTVPTPGFVYERLELAR